MFTRTAVPHGRRHDNYTDYDGEYFSSPVYVRPRELDEVSEDEVSDRDVENDDEVFSTEAVLNMRDERGWKQWQGTVMILRKRNNLTYIAMFPSDSDAAVVVHDLRPDTRMKAMQEDLDGYIMWTARDVFVEGRRRSEATFMAHIESADDRDDFKMEFEQAKNAKRRSQSRVGRPVIRDVGRQPRPPTPRVYRSGPPSPPVTRSTAFVTGANSDEERATFNTHRQLPYHWYSTPHEIPRQCADCEIYHAQITFLDHEEAKRVWRPTESGWLILSEEFDGSLRLDLQRDKGKIFASYVTAVTSVTVIDEGRRTALKISGLVDKKRTTVFAAVGLEFADVYATRRAKSFIERQIERLKEQVEMKWCLDRCQ